MNKTVIATTIAAAMALSGPAQARIDTPGEPAPATTGQAWGTGIGAVVGTALAGPVGLVAGGLLGGAIGWTEGLQQDNTKLRRQLQRHRSAEAARETQPEPDTAGGVRNLQLAGAAPAGVAPSGSRELAAALAEGFESAVYFQTGSTELAPHFAAQLARLPVLLSHFPGLIVRLDGHADPRGGDAANQALAGRRVEAVRAHLLQAGVPAGRIRAEVHGEARPLSRPDNPDSLPFDRRVRLRLDLPEAAARPLAGEGSASAVAARAAGQ